MCKLNTPVQVKPPAAPAVGQTFGTLPVRLQVLQVTGLHTRDFRKLRSKSNKTVSF